MSTQSAVFLQAYILPDQVEALTELLNSGGNPLWSDSFFPFEKLETVHFARWIIAPKTDEFKASLIYSGNVDGTQEQHLNDLVKMFPEALDAILSNCEGYPNSEGLNEASRLSYLQKNTFKTPTFYVGAPNRSVSQIRREAKLHEAVKSYVREIDRSGEQGERRIMIFNVFWNLIRSGIGHETTINYPKRSL